ncbi:MAG: patatin-like protein [Ilumatobacteraceae bacterium]
MAYGLDVEEFDELRDLWLEVGSFSQLLRNPLKKDPYSLLQGDAFFTVKIQEIISKWVDRKRGMCLLPDGQQTLTVILTTSLLSAELKPFTDDFDTEILEPNHRAMFTFQDEHFRESSLLASRLALAARTTASFPGAFEASYIPIGESNTDGKSKAANGAGTARTGRPDMDGIANFPRSHWAVDGGVLVNKPVGPALAAILKRPSNSEVRRVVAYVNPDPGSPRQEIDVEAAVPTIGEVVLKSVVSLPRAESIAEHLEELREVNQRGSDTRDLRDSLLRGVRLGPASKHLRRHIDVPNVADQLYPYWIKQRATQAVDIRLEAHFVKASIDQTHRLAEDAVKTPVTFRELRLALEQARGDKNWLASRLPVAEEPGTPDADPETPINLSEKWATWCWGFQPLEYIANLALDLIHRAFALLPLNAASVRGELGALRGRVHVERAFLRTMRAADEDYWEENLATLSVEYPDIIDCAPKLADNLYGRWPMPPRGVLRLDGEALKAPSGLETLPASDRARVELWRTFTTLVVEQDDIREREHDSEEDSLARARAVTLAKTIDKLRENLPDADDEAMAEKLLAETRTTEMRIAWALTTIVHELGGPMAQAIAISRERAETMAQKANAAPDPCAVPITDPSVSLTDIGKKLKILVDEPQLQGAETTRDRVILARLLRQLLSLYVVHSCTVANIGDSPRLELIQMSAFCENQVVPDRFLPEQKVAGLQVGHFGGFLKRSWRANDWMWGAMDGAERIIAMLIDPARLRQCFDNADDAMEQFNKILTGRKEGLAGTLDDRERQFLDEAWKRRESEIRTELELVYVPPGKPLPRRLDNLCAMATYVAQLVICKAQLPVVAQAVVTSAREGAGESIEAVEFVEALRAVMEPNPRESTADRPRRRLSIVEVGDLLERCTIGMEKATDELASDLGAATAAKAAAVAATAVSGTHAGLGLLSVPAKSIRAAVLGVYFATTAALRKTRIGVAVTFLLLAIGAGAVGARLLGADVPGSIMVGAILLLAVWLLNTGASAKAWWTSFIGALALVVIALSFIDSSAACSTFATDCAETQPGWKSNLPQIVAVVLALAALSCLVTSIRYLFERSIQRNLELLGAPLLTSRPQRVQAFVESENRRSDLVVWLSAVVKAKAFKTLVATVVLAALAVAYPWRIHAALFEGKLADDVKRGLLGIIAIAVALAAVAVITRTYVGSNSPKRMSVRRLLGVVVLVAIVVTLLVTRTNDHITLQRGDIVRWVRTLGDNRAIVVLMGLPAVFIALEYARTQYQLLHAKSAHRKALVRLRSAAAKKIA